MKKGCKIVGKRLKQYWYVSLKKNVVGGVVMLLIKMRLRDSAKRGVSSL